MMSVSQPDISIILATPLVLPNLEFIIWEFINVYPFIIFKNNTDKDYKLKKAELYFNTTDSCSELLIQQYNGENQNYTYYYEGKNYDESYWYEDFCPIYEDNDQIIFKSTLIHFDSSKNNAWYESVNYHMVKTDDGWKFDVFN